MIELLLTPTEVASELGRRARSLRLARSWRRSTLAERCGVSVSTVQRFETTGRITLENLLKVVDTLGRLGEFEDLLAAPAAQSLAELEARAATSPRKRGRK